MLPTTPPPAPSLASRFDQPAMRLVILGILILLLLIPAGMIQGVVAERQAREGQAIDDVRSKWGGAQLLTGPILRLPYVTRSLRKNSEGKEVEDVMHEVAYVLPTLLSIKGQVGTELRARGLYQVPVYGAKLQLQGSFARPALESWSVKPEDIDWAHAELLLGLTEPRALHADATLTWGGHTLRFRPSTGQNGQWALAGIHSTLGEELGKVFDSPTSSFEIALSFNGSGEVMFTPTAEETEVSLSAAWPHPAFQGNWLPIERQIDTDRFSARWSVSHLGRDFPQLWRESSDIQAVIAKSAFGVALTDPVNQYSLADRITKYAIVVLVFTFAVVWLTEVLSGTRTHVIQYALIGGALCLFGLLQLSFAEHFGFAIAFMVASGAVIILVTLYSKAALASLRKALAVGGVLSGLYGYLYMVLQAEDYALLGGTLALFAGLATVMYLTRRIDWFSSGRPAAPASPT